MPSGAFQDLEEFVSQHRACGKLTPGATPQTADGFAITLVCSCGAVFERRVTGDEALAGPPRLGGEAAPVPLPPPPPPAPRRAPDASKFDDLVKASLDAVEKESPAGAPAAERPVPQSNLEDLVQASLAAIEAEPGAAPAARPGVPAAKPAAAARAIPKLNLDATMKAAVATIDELEAAPRRSRAPKVVLGLVAVLLVVGAVWYVAVSREEPTAPAAPAGPRLNQLERRSVDEAVAVLKALRSVSVAGTGDYRQYATRVFDAKVYLDRYLASEGGDPELKRLLGESIGLYLLTEAAWGARLANEPVTWETVGRDRRVEACAPAKRSADTATEPASVSRDHRRGIVIAAAIQALWACAQDKVAEVERLTRDR